MALLLVFFFKKLKRYDFGHGVDRVRLINTKLLGKVEIDVINISLVFRVVVVASCEAGIVTHFWGKLQSTKFSFRSIN